MEALSMQCTNESSTKSSQGAKRGCQVSCQVSSFKFFKVIRFEFIIPPLSCQCELMFASYRSFVIPCATMCAGAYIHNRQGEGICEMPA
eukprot:3472784-Amphidinium_carterae.1